MSVEFECIKPWGYWNASHHWNESVTTTTRNCITLTKTAELLVLLRVPYIPAREYQDMHF